MIAALAAARSGSVHVLAEGCCAPVSAGRLAHPEACPARAIANVPSKCSCAVDSACLRALVGKHSMPHAAAYAPMVRQSAPGGVPTSRMTPGTAERVGKPVPAAISVMVETAPVLMGTMPARANVTWRVKPVSDGLATLVSARVLRGIRVATGNVCAIACSAEYVTIPVSACVPTAQRSVQGLVTTLAHRSRCASPIAVVLIETHHDFLFSHA